MEVSLVIAVASLAWAILWGVFTFFKQKSPEKKGTSHKKNSSLPEDTSPKIWSVPFPRNNNFTGREELLTQIAIKLDSDESDLRFLAVFGLGGIGKTQLALEYIHRNQEKYQTILWLNAEDAASLDNDYTKLASLLDLNIRVDASQSLIHEKIREWFRLHEDWLLVFDNAEGPQQIRKYLPSAGCGHVLITTQNPNWEDIAIPMRLPEWSLEESVFFLQKRTRKNDMTNAEKIAILLGNLPLALAQAAAYIDTKKKNFVEYVELFNSQHDKLWKKEISPVDYSKKTVTATWKLAMSLVEEEAPIAMDILNFCAYLAPDNIPRAFLYEIQSKDEIEVDDGLETLNRYSLIDLKESHVSLHRLVQLVVRDNLKDQGKDDSCETAIKKIAERYPPNALRDIESWPECISLLPHAQAVIRNAMEVIRNTKELKIAAKEISIVQEISILLNNVNLYYYARRVDYLIDEGIRNYCDFTILLEPLAEQNRGRLEYELALCYNNLGRWLTENGNFPVAETFLIRSLRIRESLGQASVDTAQTLNNLSWLLLEMKRYSEAEGYIRPALKIYEDSQGSRDPDVAMCLNSLGLSLFHQGKLLEAEENLRRSHGIREYSKVFPELSESLYSLALVLNAQSKYSDAEKYIRSSLEIYERELGLNHRLIGDALKLHMEILIAQNKEGEAKEYSHYIFKKASDLLGEGHSITRDIVRKLKSINLWVDT